MTRRIFCKVLLVVVVIFGLLVLSGVLMAQGRSEDAFERARGAQERNTNVLMARPGVVGTAVGFNDDGEYAVLVLLEIPGVAGIPQELDGVPVQAVVTGRFHALADPTARFDRPVPIGVSTGHPKITAGTIGCRVKDGDGNVYALSNNHVYANQNKASIGDNVLQPGTFDGGVNPDDAIGALDDFEEIKFAKGRRIPRNTMDAAIALSSIVELGNATPGDGYGTPSSTPVSAYVGQPVQKYGRTSKLTSGQVSAVNVIVDVCYEGLLVCSKWARFVDQIMISDGSFSDPGDSGSLVVDYSNNPVGLLFAGSDTHTIANRIDLVLQRFGVTVDGGAPPAPGPTGSIGGTVTDNSTGATIDGATISLDTGQSTTTANNGTYIITDVPTGDRSVTASADGFESQTKTATVNEIQTTTVDFALSPAQSGGTLSVGVTTDKGTYVLGERVYITVTVTDGTSGVEGAAVHVEITTASNRQYAGDGMTNASGTAKFSFKIKKPDGIGTYSVTADASKSGYDPGSGSTTFDVQ